MNTHKTGNDLLTLNKYFEEIITSEPNTLRSEVARVILDNTEDSYSIQQFLDDLFKHGCISGMVGDLVYYADTRAFYDKHYQEIEQLREQWHEATGQSLKIKGDLKNFLAWFGFEYTADQLYRAWESEQ